MHTTVLIGIGKKLISLKFSLDTNHHDWLLI